MAKAKTPIQVAIDIDGPFFKRDPAKTFRENARGMLEDLETQAILAIRSDLRSGQAQRAPVRGGGKPRTPLGIPRVAGHVVGSRVFGTARRPHDMVFVARIKNIGFTKQQAISLMAAGAEIEKRQHTFRKTAARLRKSGKVNAAELLKGLN